MTKPTRYFHVRPRRVPPEFCSDERLEECTLLAALLNYRLITQADDQGRLPGHPKYIRAICFPMRPDITVRKVEMAMSELRAAGFIIVYQVEGKDYLQVDRWWDLQGTWGRRAYPSRYPAGAGWADRTFGLVEAPVDEVLTEGEQVAGDLPPPIPFSSAVATSVSTSPPVVSSDQGARTGTDS